MTAKQPRGIIRVAVEYRLISLPMGEDLVTKRKEARSRIGRLNPIGLFVSADGAGRRFCVS